MVLGGAKAPASPPLPPPVPRELASLPPHVPQSMENSFPSSDYRTSTRRRRMRGQPRAASQRWCRATHASVAGDLGHVVLGWQILDNTEIVLGYQNSSRGVSVNVC
jgi:hypothetical protein